MTAMPALVPAVSQRSAGFRTSAIPDDEEEIIVESAGVRASVEEAFLHCTSLTGFNGYMHLDDLLSFLKRSNAAVIRSESRLREMLERCNRLVLISGDLVVWTGSPERSVLMRRMRTMIAARKSKLSVSSALTQLRRGNDRFDSLTAVHIRDIANALPEFRVIDGAIIRSGGFESQAADALTGDELRIFRMLQKTVFALPAEEINRKLGRRAPALTTILPILRESAVITDVDGGYRSIVETPTQLALRL